MKCKVKATGLSNHCLGVHQAQVEDLLKNPTQLSSTSSLKALIGEMGGWVKKAEVNGQKPGDSLSRDGGVRVLGEGAWEGVLR